MISSRRCLPYAALTSLLVLSGCVSMSPQECRTADWYEVGQRDGQNGEPRSTLEDHVKACGEAHISPDRGLYQKGWARGIVSYCTPRNGMEVGRRGSSYSGSCPAELEPAFREPYRLGREVYDAQQELNRLDSDSRTQQRKLNDAKNDDAKQQARRALRDIDDRQRRARDRLYDAERRANRY
jgi:hypothetical protein